MTHQEIRALVEMMRETGVLELETPDIKLRLSPAVPGGASAAPEPTARELLFAHENKGARRGDSRTGS